LFSRLIADSLHHLLVVPADTHGHIKAAVVYNQIKAYFSCTEWMGQAQLTRKWEAMTMCTDPEVTYNDLIDLNNQCTNAGIPYSNSHVETKFVHLLQTAHEVAYLPILSELAREGPAANIVNLWHVAQMT
jgi:hypothetical protein